MSKFGWCIALCDESDFPEKGCFLGGGGGGGQAPAGNTTTVQKSDPWSGQQPYLTTGFQKAQDLLNQGGPQYFSGQTYAGPTDAQNAAINAQISLASQGNPLTYAATGATLDKLSPDFMNANPGNQLYQNLGNGPALQGAINSAVQQATPGLLDSFTQGNRLNSPGAAYAVSQGVASAAAPYVLAGQQSAAQGLSENYNTAGQQQNQALLFAPQTAQMPYQDISNLYNAGATQQQQQQANINDQLARYNYQQTEPFNLLDWYNQQVSGTYGGTSTLTSPYFQQPGNAMGGALGGAALGGGAAYLLGASNPYIAAAAIGGGLLGGLFR